MTTFTPRCVLHAAENIKGGVGTYLRDLLVTQRAHFGEGVVMAVVPETQSDILQSPPGVEIVTFNNRGPRWLSTLRLALTVRKVVLRTSPTIIHLHSTFAGLALRPLLHWLRMRGTVQAPVVYCAHGWAFDRDTFFVSRWIAAGLERFLAPLCDSIVCISRHEMRLGAQAGIPRDRMTQISNGVPRETQRSNGTPVEWPAGRRRVLFVGRFDRQKGVDALLHAMSRIQVTSFGWFVGGSVLGDGAQLNFPPNVRSAGWLSPAEIAPYYESADVLVVPSRWEGFGLIAVEGMRAGLPVIATRVGGLTEIVEHGVTGLLVEPGNPRALVEAVRSLSDEACVRMGKAGRARFESRFTLDRVHGQLTALYQRLLDRRSSKRAAPRTTESRSEGAANA
jgi:glycosyltransferase involved in cell wall biosynthesis